MEMPAIYRASAAAFVRVVGTLTDEQLAARVPACPDWSVHDLLAHLAGSSSDLVAGRTEGVATPPWTGRQVEDRRGRSTAELVAEWTADLEAVAARCDSPAANPAWDVTAHLDDLREALGRPRVGPEEGWGDVLDAARRFLEGRRGLTVSVAEDGPDPGTTTWHVATAYGLWRGLFSRLDRAALEREIVRGDVERFARTAYFAP